MSQVWTNDRTRRVARLLWALCAAVLVWSTPVSAELPDGSIDARAPSRHLLVNGLDVTVYDADNLSARLTTLNDSPAIALGAGRYLSVITDIEDSAISNKGDGTFHPFDEEAVLSILSEVSHPHLRIPVTVYLLPYPRRNVLVSSTSGSEIFLSPHVLDISAAVAAYIVTHELGHVLHNRYLSDGTAGWGEYRRVRGIEDTYKYSESAPHANRPKEIFAEDFRVLFGGPDATWGGQIENQELPGPTLVAGLDSFFRELGGSRTYARDLVAATSFPNPFNPETEIRVVVPDDVRAGGRNVSVRIYDVTGALVRDLYSGAPSSDELRVRWDGTDGRGNQVASAQYFAQIRAGDRKTTLKLIMLK